MRIFSKALLFVILCGLLAFSVSFASAQTKDKPALSAQTVKLDPLEVTASGFGWWGVGIWGTLTGVDKSLGGPPEAVHVYVVFKGSPADLAGVQVGDEITAVNGREVTSMRWSEIDEYFHHTPNGSIVSLTLFDCIQGTSRTAKLEIGSNMGWVQDGRFDAICWGLLVMRSSPVPAQPVHMDCSIFPKEQRFREYRLSPVTQRRKIKTKQGVIYKAEPVLNEKGKQKMEPKPIYVTRRAVTITWVTSSLTLIERENRVVEVIEGRELPNKDEVVGRLMQEGSTLTLRADGAFELKDAPSKPEPMKPPPGSPAALPPQTLPAS